MQDPQALLSLVRAQAEAEGEPTHSEPRLRKTRTVERGAGTLSRNSKRLPPLEGIGGTD